MSHINQSIPEFKAEAFHDGQFKTITSDDVKGKWSIFMFYPADFTFVCPTELEDMANHYEELQ
jgi:alkyl hydroperoxide reductase subunit AhpC